MCRSSSTRGRAPGTRDCVALFDSRNSHRDGGGDHCRRCELSLDGEEAAKSKSSFSRIGLPGDADSAGPVNAPLKGGFAYSSKPSSPNRGVGSGVPATGARGSWFGVATGCGVADLGPATKSPSMRSAELPAPEPLARSYLPREGRLSADGDLSPTDDGRPQELDLGLPGTLTSQSANGDQLAGAAGILSASAFLLWSRTKPASSSSSTERANSSRRFLSLYASALASFNALTRVSSPTGFGMAGLCCGTGLVKSLMAGASAATARGSPSSCLSLFSSSCMRCWICFLSRLACCAASLSSWSLLASSISLRCTSFTALSMASPASRARAASCPPGRSSSCIFCCTCFLSLFACAAASCRACMCSCSFIRRASRSASRLWAAPYRPPASSPYPEGSWLLLRLGMLGGRPKISPSARALACLAISRFRWNSLTESTATGATGGVLRGAEPTGLARSPEGLLPACPAIRASKESARWADSGLQALSSACCRPRSGCGGAAPPPGNLAAASLTTACAKISSTLGLSPGSLESIQSTSCFTAGWQAAGNGSGSFLTIFMSSAARFSAWKGGFSAQSSYNTTPKDQMSARIPYGRLSQTSGAK
mmetsp:Transcript_21357/g.39088  ORF Transcript_21357/g.39088 Transcript_21357/m.39088 type:complete len:597 (+) Transcript_21357:516-2306(+)